MTWGRCPFRLSALLAAIVSLWGTPALAHLTPNSEINLVIHADSVTADIIIPQGEYAYATGNPAENAPGAVAEARAYLARHVSITAPDGRRWTATVDSLEFKQIIGSPDLHAVARWVPPPGTSPRRFTIDWSVLLHELPNHFALFVLAGDSGGMIGEGREILGAVRASDTRLAVDRGHSSTSVAFANAVLLGIDHILGGYDHLLFLLALLLPAPLVARGGRWCDPRPVRATLLQLLRIVTAFTIGHSLTLIGATLGDWRLPPAPVEVAIAVSVLVSAVHAIRPLLPGREHYVALLFGLVHGLAFATLLHAAGAGSASTAANLLGFNLGIEAVQLFIVALVIPPLLILSRAPGFTWLRTGCAGFTVLAAAAWIVNRTTGAGGDGVATIEMVVSHGLWGIAALYLLALERLIAMRLHRGTADPPLPNGSSIGDATAGSSI
jgi:hypothetical protein